LIPYDGFDLGSVHGDTQRFVAGLAGNVVHTPSFSVEGMFSIDQQGPVAILAAGNDYAVLRLTYSTAWGGLAASYENAGAWLAALYFVVY